MGSTQNPSNGYEKEQPNQPVEVNGKYVYPRGFDGTPFRTSKEEPPLYNNQEQQTKIVNVSEGNVEVLDLSKEEDLQRYQKILNLCASGLAGASNIVREWVESKENWKVLIEYAVYYNEPSDEYYNRMDGEDGILVVS